MGWTCGTHGRNHKRIQGFGGKPHVISRRGWQDNKKMDFKETGMDDVGWIHMTQVRELADFHFS
jgi:hypothetical protein